MNVVKLLTEGLEDVVGATFAVEADPQKHPAFSSATLKRSARRWVSMHAKPNPSFPE